MLILYVYSSADNDDLIYDVEEVSRLIHDVEETFSECCRRSPALYCNAFISTTSSADNDGDSDDDFISFQLRLAPRTK